MSQKIQTVDMKKVHMQTLAEMGMINKASGAKNILTQSLKLVFYIIKVPITSK